MSNKMKSISCACLLGFFLSLGCSEVDVGCMAKTEQQFAQFIKVSQDGLPEVNAFKKTTVTSPLLCSFDCTHHISCFSFVFLKHTATENCLLSTDPNGCSSSQDSVTFKTTFRSPNHLNEACNHNNCQRGSKCVSCSAGVYECDCPPWATGSFCEHLNPQYNQILLPWKQAAGTNMRTVDIAFDTAWCTTGYNNIWINTNGDGWTLVLGIAHQVSIGESGVWVVNTYTARSFSRTGVTESNPSGTIWIVAPGLLEQVTSGPGMVWGVNRVNGLYYYQANAWTLIEVGYKWVSCGKFGCWAVTTDGSAYFRLGVTASTPAGDSWVNTGGSFTQLDTGVRGEVYALDNSGQLYTREGVSENSPEGTKWSKFGNKFFKHVSVGDNCVVAISLDGNEFRLC